MSNGTLTIPDRVTFGVTGVHPPEGKTSTSGLPTEVLPPPQSVVIPLSQHLGAPCKPIVEKGAQVKVGTLVGSSDRPVSAFVHSSISGKVKSIEHLPHPLGSRVPAIEIESDGQDIWEEGIDRSDDIREPNYKDTSGWLEKIRQAGIAGMGGAGFPTHIKLSPPPDKKIDTVIFNGAECEPLLTADHRLMLEHPKEILIGGRIIQAILKAEQAVLGIEDNKLDAVGAMQEAAKSVPGIRVVVCRTKYPQGGEKQLIKAVLNREVPSRGLPMDVGVVVDNVGTCYAVYQAVMKSRPLLDRVLTVTGPGVPRPKNLLVRIGTAFSDVLAACGVELGENDKLIMGGPMMGRSIRRPDVPVIKATSGILVFPSGTLALRKEQACLRCARCVEVCPMGLVPTELAGRVRAKTYDKLEGLGIHDCMECGCCSYDCPSAIDLVHWIRLGKFEITAKAK